MVYYLKLAANQGHADGLYAFALCRRDGTGISRDIEAAKELLILSSEAGNSDAQELLDTLV